ncbi:hypothetical protein BJ508DRAFT_335845 [Ascobolus immersus RN42]|uniref:Uncharacterized protein n=1 Tax=Ascobolus immersus RN42 TaxID=1160509 RepID=A0A3N4HHZ1_ASCIM|nr:hypothetical protein BJ508DRAFT_335845 [Ascobolus immersus RN42]
MGFAAKRRKLNVEKKIYHRKPKGERWGGGEGSKKYRKRRAMGEQGNLPHWCVKYTDTKVFKENQTKFLFEHNHIQWVLKKMQEENFYGLANHPQGTPEELAIEVMTEVGGCDQKSPKCKKLLQLLIKKMSNLGADMRKEAKIVRVKEPSDVTGQTYIPGVEVLRSGRWYRDREIASSADDVEEDELPTVYRIYQRRFPTNPAIAALPIPADTPTIEEILNDDIDLYEVTDNDVAGDEIESTDEEEEEEPGNENSDEEE